MATTPNQGFIQHNGKIQTCHLTHPPYASPSPKPSCLPHEDLLAALRLPRTRCYHSILFTYHDVAASSFACTCCTSELDRPGAPISMCMVKTEESSLRGVKFSSIAFARNAFKNTNLGFFVDVSHSLPRSGEPVLLTVTGMRCDRLYPLIENTAKAFKSTMSCNECGRNVLKKAGLMAIDLPILVFVIFCTCVVPQQNLCQHMFCIAASVQVIHQQHLNVQCKQQLMSCKSVIHVMIGQHTSARMMYRASSYL